MKAQLHNLRTALWWFQRQSEAKQSAGIGRSTAPKLPAFMNRVSPATSAPHRVSQPRSGPPLLGMPLPACETHRRSVGLSQPIHTQAHSAIIKSATPALGAQIAGGAASATPEEQAALDEYYREQGLLGGNSMSTHVSRCVRS